jgi:Tfp pilus assembly protein PilO
MAEGKLISIKRIKINKANQTIVAMVAASSFIFVFSLVAVKSLASQYSYQSRVTTAQQKTVNQLQTDNQAATKLVSSYNTFANQSTNIIGGVASGSTSQDGSNTKIILDALPDTYDFPALVVSFENLLSQQGVDVESISASDTGGTSSVATPTTTTTLPTSTTSQASPIAIPLTFEVSGSYSNLQSLLLDIQRSIRPYQIQSIELSGNDSGLEMNIQTQTYYLPPSGLKFTSETIK